MDHASWITRATFFEIAVITLTKSDYNSIYADCHYTVIFQKVPNFTMKTAVLTVEKIEA